MNAPPSHLSAQTLAAYRDRRVSAAEAIAASDHLAGCPECRDALAWLSAHAVDPEEFLLETDEETLRFDEMAALLDDTLDASQRQSISAGLEASPGSAAELEDLRAFQSELAAMPPTLYGPKPESDPAPAPGKIIAVPLWRWFPLASAAAVILLAAGGWWWQHPTPNSNAATALWTDDAGNVADLALLPGGLRTSILEGTHTGRIASAPLPDGLQPSGGPLSGEKARTSAFRQISPVGVRVREERPRLRWTPREGATDYVVYLKSMEGRRTTSQQIVPAGTTEWSPVAPLARGGVYEWQVAARHDGEIVDQAPQPPAGEARFQILDTASAAEVETLERRYRAYPLILGAVYARAGLTGAAAEQFQELARRRPDSVAARDLSRSFVSQVPPEAKQ